MTPKTLSFLKCPSCNSPKLSLGSKDEVVCEKCRSSYPVLAGVLVLVEDVESYLIEHVKGISRHVDAGEIPKKFRESFLEAKSEIQVEHIEEDLEAERVTSLYLMNHYLHANDVRSPDPVINELIKKHWDNGPFSKIREKMKASQTKRSLIELGCGVGGLFAALKENISTYLGLDSSFASIALARHFALGAPIRNKKTLVPDDLLLGAVSREIKISAPSQTPPNAEFIVCDLSDPPVQTEKWEMCAALNVIDMLPEPDSLPRLQKQLLIDGGVAIQSSPYIWHPEVAKKLKRSLPKDLNDSAKAVTTLYEKNGFKIESNELHIPWLFFKNVRQLEIYSVHLLWSKHLK